MDLSAHPGGFLFNKFMYKNQRVSDDKILALLYRERTELFVQFFTIKSGDAMNQFVIADPKRCIGCFACIAACVETHRGAGLQAYPRLFITYTQTGMMPVQCRHCEDAPCSAVCPVKAIEVTHNTVHLNESLCIGCKMCVLACPFGAIVTGGTNAPQFEFNLGHYAYLNTPYQPGPMHLRELDVSQSLSLLSWNSGQKTVAVKCDLCSFRAAGPACVLACPHQALRLVYERDIAEIPWLAQAKTVPDVSGDEQPGVDR
jgi:Fe-S-cluster-containing hydrogenase component 2